MTSADLKPEQARKLMDSVGRRLQYLNRLCDRMEHCGFTPTDPLYQAAFKAKDAAQQLFMAAHYAGCTSGVGKAPVSTDAAASGRSR